MLATLATATSNQSSFSMTNLIILILVAAVVYPLQKKLRESVSRRRKEQWAEKDRLADLERDEQDGPQRPDRLP
ncbi:MAG: hypothetical protein HOQ18_17850 [Dermatophilaceae bacterium]|nr:hypothetical protein [Dermatophilaceae bacterium]NUO92665.1 hypothetical protein [Dermatophilaceae bacterium]NUQ32409.1 hypothetical protein [Dermatophilaceae bacterium]NUR16902.1 hypothetical protein [Dermatophilaceae bacterium]NUR80091.1 hypothetical protein [Dermatophilaceae bacterium]